MGLSNHTRLYLQSEGIIELDDLIDFVKKEAWDQVLKNCKRPPQVPNPADATQLIPQAAFQFPAKSLLRLRVAALVVQYYDRTGRALSAGGMLWPRLSNFQVEWDSLKERKESNDEPNMPTISNKLSITAFFKAYETFTDGFIGQIGCPLRWIYREDENVPAVAPPLEANQPFSTEHGSIADEMAMRLSHNHPLFKADNATGYAQLVTATLGTQYASTISPFKRTKNGRGAYRALKAQFASKAHWDKEVKVTNDFLLNGKWSGTTAFTLHGILAKHRASYHTLQRCAEHVAIEIPNERTRVGYLLDNIDCNDKNVTTALSHIRLDDNVGGMRSDFERAVVFLLPTDPVRSKRGGV